MAAGVEIICGDALAELRKLPENSVHCCITSPPYWGLRDYGQEGQLGLEKTPEEYVARMVAVFREVRRVLRDDGTLWLNLGDTYASSQSSDSRTPEERAKSSTLGPKRDGLGGENAGHRSVSFEPRPRIHGIKPKDLVGIPWRVAFALQADGWYLRQDIIWHKPNPMPESVTDRCTKAHEYVFLLSKSARYYYDAEAVKERGAGLTHSKPGASGTNDDARKTGRKIGKMAHETGTRDGANLSDAYFGVDWSVAGRNRRSVWTVATQPFKGAHFAVFPPKLIEPMVLAGCPVSGTVLDPFLGSGTTAMVALQHGRRCIGIELNPDYCEMSRERIAAETVSLFAAVAVGA